MAKDRFGDIGILEEPKVAVGRFDTIAVEQPRPSDRFGDLGLAEPVAELDKAPGEDIFEKFILSDRPIENWLPTEQAEVAGYILDSIEDPHWRERLNSALLLSDMFGVDADEILVLQPQMMKQMFGDELVNISERFKKEPVEGGFFKKVAESWRRGDKQIMSDIAVYEAAFEGYGNEEDALAISDKVALEQLLNPIEGKFVAKLVYSGVEVIPGMARGYWSALPEATAGMAAGVLAGLALGQVPPLTISPIEDLPLAATGVITGLTAGLMAGSTMFWYKQGAGSMYAAMRKNDYDPELSKHIAGVAAIPYAIVELLQVTALTPGLRRGALNVGKKSMLRVIAGATKKWGTTWTEEVFEEVVQELIQVVAEDTAGFLSDKLELPEGVSTFLLERGQRLWEATKAAGQAMALLPVPGAVIDVTTGTKSVVNQRRKADINAKLFAERAKDFTAEEKTGVVEQAKTRLNALENKEKGPAEVKKLEPVPKLTADEITERDFLRENADNADAVIGTYNLTPPVPEVAVAPVAAKVEPVRPTVPPEPIVAKPAAVIPGTKKTFDEVQAPTVEEAEAVVPGTDIQFDDVTTYFDSKNNWVSFRKDGEEVHSFKVRNAAIADQQVKDFKTLLKAPAAIERRVVQFFREGRQVHEIQVDSVEEQTDVLKAHQAILAEKGREVERRELLEVVEEARMVERRAKDKQIKDLQEDITELEKLQAENKKLEGTTQFDPAFDKFATKQIKKKTKEIERIEIGKPVEAVGKKVLGLTRAEIELLTPAQQKELRLEQARGLKVGFRAGEEAARERAKTEVLKFVHAQKITESHRDAARELVMKFVPQDLRGDFLYRVTKARTAKDVRKIAATIEKGIARFEKRDAIEDLREAARAISPKKMLPEFAETARAILQSIQIGKIRLDTMLRNSDLKDMAQQVLDTAREDSVAAVRAQQLLEELREKTTRTFAVNQLSVEAINQITDTLIALRFQNELDTIAARDENATEAIRRRDEIKKAIVEPPAVPESLGGKAVKKFKLFHDNMESVLDAVSGARAGTYELWNKTKRATTEFIYDVLNKGVDDQVIHSEKARDIFRRILTDNEVTQKDILNWSMRPEDIPRVKKAFEFGPKPQVHKFTLENARGKETEFEFTTNELMSIFMHFSNNHNLEVLLKDGLDRIVRGKKQKIRGFTIETLEEMVNALTEQQKKVARQVGSKLMDGFNKNAINETSVRLEFFELADVVRYWPARRSITRILRGRKLAGTVKTVEGMGLLKERVGTGNPLKLTGFFETVYATNKNVAAYVGLAEPLREVKAVYSKETIEELENAGREKEAKLITDLIERFEGQSTLIGPLDTIIKRMLGGFAKAKLFLNIKIAPRQQISSFLISAYVDNKYITEFRGIGTKKLTEEINELSPQMKGRFEQLQFDRDIGDAFIENELMNYLTGKTTLIDKTAIGMRFFDKNAIIDVYRATKAEVIDKNPGININSKEGKALLKDRFEWVTRHTQPMWHPKDRSLIGADPRPLIRSLTMFMSQREQLVRMVNNGIADYVNSKKTIEDATRLGRTLGTVALNLAAFTLYNFAWAVLIHRKKRDIWDLGKFFLNDILSLPFFGKYIARSFEITFNALVGRPIFSRDFDEGPIEGILGRILLEAIPNFALAGKHFVTKEKYGRGHPLRGQERWKNELLVAVDALVDAIASLKGIPYYGAKDIVKSVKAQLPEEKGRKPLFTGVRD